MREFHNKFKKRGERPRRNFNQGRSWGRSFNMDKPVNEGEEHTVVIKELGSQGDGITRIKNFVVFVPGTAKGDTVRIKITGVKGRHAIGEIMPEGPAEVKADEPEPKPKLKGPKEPEPAPEEEKIDFAG